MVIRRSLRDMVFKTYLSSMGRYGMHEKCPSVVKGHFMIVMLILHAWIHCVTKAIPHQVKS